MTLRVEKSYFEYLAYTGSDLPPAKRIIHYAVWVYVLVSGSAMALLTVASSSVLALMIYILVNEYCVRNSILGWIPSIIVCGYFVRKTVKDLRSGVLNFSDLLGIVGICLALVFWGFK
jgi:hypothetical protein